MHLAGGFVLINLSPGWIRPRRVIGRQWRIGVTKSNYMLDANRIGSDAHGEVMGQLALDLSAKHIDGGDLQIWLDLVNSLGYASGCRIGWNQAYAIRGN